MNVGATAFTRIPCVPHSIAITLVRRFSRLAGAIGGAPGMATRHTGTHVDDAPPGRRRPSSSHCLSHEERRLQVQVHDLIQVSE